VDRHAGTHRSAEALGATFVIVGAGQAGGWAARTLRDEGFDGRVVLVGEELHPPHERPPLAKGVLLGSQSAQSTYLWSRPQLAEQGIDFRDASRAVELCRAERKLSFAAGAPLTYDRLLLATGARVRKLDVPGNHLAGIHYLRTIEDALAVRDGLGPHARVLVVGGGWIGLETAAAARRRGAHVTVVEAGDRLCARALSPQLSDYVLDLHRRQGVEVMLDTSVRSFAGDGRASTACLSSGAALEVTLVVIGIGIVAEQTLAQAAGLEVGDGVFVDEFCRTSDPSIFAAGDVASHVNRFAGRRLRLESWANAQNQAIAAARAMLDKASPYQEIPWFWSDQFDVNMQFLGVASGFGDVVVRPSPERDRFTHFHIKNGRIEAIAAINNARDVRMARTLIQRNARIDPARLADPSIGILESEILNGPP
jgi:3-phenylpropionate/trans-cinnamate dioxygenase ferredoxin reductase subunit